MKRIILIEDNEADALLIEDALATSGLICEVTWFRDGSDAISALLEEGAQVPDVILLDLNMPRSNGLDVLRTIRNTPRLTYAQVGILTGSEARSDELRANALGATRYVRKCASYDDYVQGVRKAVAELLEQPSTSIPPTAGS
jgi:CheY-like chemotaxis protein